MCSKCKITIVLPKKIIVWCDECEAYRDRSLCSKYDMIKVLCPTCGRNVFSYCIRRGAKE